MSGGSNIEEVSEGAIVRKEVYRIMKEIMPKPQDQSTAIDDSREYIQAHQNQNEYRR